MTWDVPASTGGNNIVLTAYILKVRAKDGTYLEDTANCNGANNKIMTARSCSIPMSVLTSSNYNLFRGDAIYVHVEA